MYGFVSYAYILVGPIFFRNGIGACYEWYLCNVCGSSSCDIHYVVVSLKVIIYFLPF